MKLHELTIHQARELLRAGEVSSMELTQACLDRIGDVDERVRAYLNVTEELALAQAREADRRRREGEDTPLLGIPLAIKDVICMRGAPTTCGSKFLEDFTPPYNATVIGRLREAGAIILGKTNMDEFAMGSSTENSAFGPTHNPWDLDHVPGGSSGGSAAAVAADECLGSLGSDTGGSIRQPASFCGVAGIKPSYGRVSRYGLVAFASSLDQIGPLGKDVHDCAILLQAIAGHDERESTSMPLEVADYEAELEGAYDLSGLRIGVPGEYFIEGMQAEVEGAVRRAIEVLAELGATMEEVSLPHTEYALPVYYLIAPAEASANLARYDGVR
ncbi:MAG: amidase family protein, partial [Chloroflexota bacterium]|nr:amidase family protein [Chloroflexota bacterium]